MSPLVTVVAVSLGYLGWVVQVGALLSLYATSAALVSRGERRRALTSVALIVLPWLLFVGFLAIRDDLIHAYPLALAAPVGGVAGFWIARRLSPSWSKQALGLVAFSVVSVGLGFQLMPDWITYAFSRDRPLITEASLSDVRFRHRDGRVVDEDEWRGKTVVLDFWNTTCGACYASFPQVAEFRDSFADEDSVEVYTVHLTTGPEDRREGLRRYEKGEYTVPVLLSSLSTREAMDRFGIRGVPNAMILRPDGSVHYVGHPQYRRGAFVQNAWTLVREAQDHTR
ncbi:MAG: TlpA disulfide reductase family protein [Bacteroidota bacterium]